MMDLRWRLRRLVHSLRRLTGSMAARGVRGTLQRVFMELKRARESRRHSLPSEMPGAAVPGEKRILVVDSMAPDPTRDSGSVRLLEMLGILRESGWTVLFLPDDGMVGISELEQLRAAGSHVVKQQLGRWLTEHGDTLDAVLLCRLAVASQHIGIVRARAPRARIIFDTVDLHYIRESRAAALADSASMRKQADRSRRLELEAIAASDVTLVVSDIERDILTRDTPGSHVIVVSNIHTPVGRKAPFAARSGLLFVGGFGHPPNAEAVRWFIDAVLPSIRAADPSIVFHLVGDIDDASRKALSGDGVHVHGRVTDILPLMERSRLSVAPLRFGAGVKGKVNQAMAHGLPVVVTSVAAEGMHLRDGVDALVADGADDFARAVLRAYGDEVCWNRLSDGGPLNIREHFSREAASTALRAALATTTPPSGMR